MPKLVGWHRAKWHAGPFGAIWAPDHFIRGFRGTRVHPEKTNQPKPSHRSKPQSHQSKPPTRRLSQREERNAPRIRSPGAFRHLAQTEVASSVVQLMQADSDVRLGAFGGGVLGFGGGWFSSWFPSKNQGEKVPFRVSWILSTHRMTESSLINHGSWVWRRVYFATSKCRAVGCEGLGVGLGHRFAAQS